MNCFVIMPFAPEFDDVYGVIKASVESVVQPLGGECLRLDEIQAAGRITERLLHRLHASTFCVADLTGLRPNVMWEVGFAMALGHPTIILTQDANSLPFDLKDMRTVVYDRTRLTLTLAHPLKQSTAHTVALLPTGKRATPQAAAAARDDAYATLVADVAALKGMLTDAMRAWKTDSPPVGLAPSDPAPLVGGWIDERTGSRFYSRVVGGNLVTPYAYGKASALTGFFYDWRGVGEHWFGRFKWLNDEAAGLAFVRQESPDKLVGAWWESEATVPVSAPPPKHVGVSTVWARLADERLPAWAQQAFDDVERRGLAAVLDAAGN